MGRRRRMRGGEEMGKWGGGIGHVLEQVGQRREGSDGGEGGDS